MSNQSEVARSKGRVKWMNVKVGYGMIIPEGGGADIFFHRSSLEIEGFAYIPPGVKVTYLPTTGGDVSKNNGLRATKVQLDLE